MRARPSSALFIFAMLALPLAVQAVAQSAGDAKEVSIASVGARVRLETHETSSLRAVMAVLCASEKLECSGKQLIPNESVPALILEGSLREVVDRLLEGTDLNYDYSPGTTEAQGKLTLLARAPVGLPSQDVRTVESYGAGAPQLPKDAGGPSTPASSGQSGVWEPSQTVASESSPWTPPGSEATQQLLQQMELMFKGTGTIDPDQQRYQPFPDQFGNRIPVNSSPGQYLPFPDRNGNPIPVKPGQSGWPFPIQTSPPTDTGGH